jgi:hypothetical protein
MVALTEYSPSLKFDAVRLKRDRLHLQLRNHQGSASVIDLSDPAHRDTHCLSLSSDGDALWRVTRHCTPFFSVKHSLCNGGDAVDLKACQLVLLEMDRK